jgi:cell division septation protein DedD
MAVAALNPGVSSNVSGKLVVPPADAGPWVLTQVERGYAIRKSRIRSSEELEKARARKTEWVAQTHDMLAGMFDTDAIATAFNEWDVRVLPDYAEMHEFAELFYEEMDQRLAKLKSIHRRIPPAAPVAAPAPAPMPRPVTDDAAADEPVSLIPPTSEIPVSVGQQRCVLIADAASAETAEGVCDFLSQLGFNAHVVHDPTNGSPVRLPPTVFAVFVVAAPPTHRLAYELGLCAGRCGSDHVFVLAGQPTAWPEEMGIAPIVMDASELWQLHFARKLKRAGVEVDLNRLA